MNDTHLTESQHIEQRITQALVTIRREWDAMMPTGAPGKRPGGGAKSTLITAADDDDNDGADERDTSLAGAAIVARRGWPAEDNSFEWRHTFSYSSTRETTSIQERHIAYVGLPKRLAPNGPSSTTLPHWMWPPCSSYSRRMHCYSMFTTSKGFFWNDPSA